VRAPLLERINQATVRRAHLSLVLRTLSAEGPSSRSVLAARTGFSKGSLAVLVADLESRGLVKGDAPEPAGVGRPGQMVGLDGSGIYGIGLEIGVDHLSVLTLNLRGEVLLERTVLLDVPSSGVQLALDVAADLAAAAADSVASAGATVLGVTVAVPGLVDCSTGRVDISVGLSWRDLPLAEALRERVRHPDWPLRVDNDVNLSAAAEHSVGAERTAADIVVLSGGFGAGAGVLSRGAVLRGAAGFAAELGHLPLDPAGHRCPCGRTGCWETMVGLPVLLRALAAPDDRIHDPAMDPQSRLAEIARRAAAGDDRTLRGLRQIGTSIGLGASVMANLFDPQVLVLGGWFAVLSDYLLEPVEAELAARVVARGTGYRVSVSTLGLQAAVLGAALVPLEALLHDPTLVPVRDNERNARSMA
jgi:predicted NBD/HSP70 family sugar kinase